MTPEQQRIAIAVACRGVFVDDSWHYPNGAKAIITPDYLNDLNAMHEAEKKLTLKQQMLYQGMIGKVTGNKCPALFGQIHATATQRAEAFLRTIGKWKES